MSMGTQETEQAWETIADGYDAYVTPTHHWLADQALDRVRLRTGDRLLDVAAGSGALSLPAARRGAKVLAVDLSARMLSRLAARAQAEGLDVATRVMDGHRLELADDTFDHAASQFGVMLFPDLPRGLREMVRVTRPGGKVLLNVYGAPQEVQFLQVFLEAMRQVVPGFTGLPMDPPPLPFQVADPRRLHDRFEEAGLRDVQIETVRETLTFASGNAMWDWVVNSNPLATLLIADLDARQRQEVQAVLDRLLQERTDGKGRAQLTNPVHIAIGTVDAPAEA